MVSAILNGGLSHLFSIYSNGCAFGIPRLHLFSGAIIVPETSTNRPLIFPLVPVALAFVPERFPCIRDMVETCRSSRIEQPCAEGAKRSLLGGKNNVGETRLRNH
jgi:hypothetical protein